MAGASANGKAAGADARTPPVDGVAQATQDRLPPGAWLPVIVELAEPVPGMETRGAAALHVTALWRGQPLGSKVLSCRFEWYAGEALASRLMTVFARELREYEATQLFTPPRQRPLPVLSATVIVCTRNRLDSLRRCLEALSELEPREALGVLVVDNGDGDETTRVFVEGLGFRWVREPVAGLDRARNRGLLETTTDIVLFTDDDVQVLPGWANALLDCFDDPLVAVATGLVLPAVLDSVHQQQTERYYGFSRGHQQRVLDGVEHDPTSAGALGAGASMAFRRQFLLDIGGFPEVLDGGMPTKSGGDTYALYRVLRAGFRGVYQPRALALHWHRDGRDELIRTVAGYSTGTYSFLLYALLHDRDPRALTGVATWTLHGIAGRLGRAVLRHRSAPPASVVLADVYGGLRAPLALRRATAIVRKRGQLLGARGIAPSPRPQFADEADKRPPTDFETPVSVVIPTRGRLRSVTGLVQELDHQSCRPREIVVVVDGDVDGTATALRSLRLSTPLRVIVHETNKGAAEARNSGARAATGDWLLFLDDDVRPVDTELIAAHLRGHEAGAAVIGPCLAGDVSDESPLTLGVRNWWADHVDRLSWGTQLTFTDLCTGNFSISKDSFVAAGGFHPMSRREDWEFSYRLLRTGVRLHPAPSAAVVHPVDHDLANMLGDRTAEGAGDFEFATRHPEIAHVLPVGAWTDMSARYRIVVKILFLAPQVGAVGLLRVLSAAVRIQNLVGRRRAFRRSLGRANVIAYWTGVVRAAGTEMRLAEVLGRARATNGRDDSVMDYELVSERWPDPDASVTTLRLTVEGRVFASVPYRWGGFPWSVTQLGHRLRAGFTAQAVADLLTVAE